MFAKNSAGTISEASEQSEAVTCKSEIVPPRVEFDAKLRDTMVVRAGDSVKLEAIISGIPLIFYLIRFILSFFLKYFRF